jgi:hypothetical protein
MKRCLVAILLCLAVPVVAQTVALTVTLSGSDVVLTWTGGTGPFEVIRSDSPSMTTRNYGVKDISSPRSMTGDAADGAVVHYYIISDSTAPTVAIATPSADFTATMPCYCATGTSTGATEVYCDTHSATGTTTWAACSDSTGPPIAVQADPKQSSAIVVTASAVDASGNWAYATVTGSYTGTITNRVPCKARAQGM